MQRFRQEGAVGTLVVVVLVLVMLGFLATYALSRLTSTVDAQAQTTAALSAATGALEQFASATGRLPCPADPVLDTGVAVPDAAQANCDKPEGTLPWKSLGMRRDDSFDSWGRKISYRVFSGGTGLTQANGASMVDCDTNEAFPVGVMGNGLCPPTHDADPDSFLANKGLPVTDFGKQFPNVAAKQLDGAAFVLVSHGATGLGGYTASGVRLDSPLGEERNNTKDTGPFVAKAFSPVDTPVGSVAFFDDLIAYRTVGDLAKRANLAARNWPDDIHAAVKFDRPTLEAALGQNNPSGDLGTSTVSFRNATASAFSSSGAQNLSFQDGQGLGGTGGGSDGLSSTGGEGLRVNFAESSRQFAFTLDDFGYQSTFFGIPIRIERVELKFYDVVSATQANLVNTVVKFACNPDGGLASYTVDAGGSFNRVEIRPMTTLLGSTASYFSLFEIRTCVAGVACQTSAATLANTCS